MPGDSTVLVVAVLLQFTAHLRTGAGRPSLRQGRARTAVVKTCFQDHLKRFICQALFASVNRFDANRDCRSRKKKVFRLQGEEFGRAHLKGYLPGMDALKSARLKALLTDFDIRWLFWHTERILTSVACQNKSLDP